MLPPAACYRRCCCRDDSSFNPYASSLFAAAPPEGGLGGGSGDQQGFDGRSLSLPPLPPLRTPRKTPGKHVCVLPSCADAALPRRATVLPMEVDH